MGHLDEVDGQPQLSLGKFFLFPFINRMARTGGEFLVRARCIVADQAIDIFRLGKVETGILEAVPGVTARTAGPVSGKAHAEVIQGIDLADVDLSAFFVELNFGPCPMNGLHKVPGFLLVAFYAPLGDLRAVLERPFTDEGAVVRLGDRRQGKQQRHDGRGNDSENLHAKPSSFPYIVVIEEIIREISVYANDK
jgi:hypothetical protein